MSKGIDGTGDQGEFFLFYDANARALTLSHALVPDRMFNLEQKNYETLRNIY